mmetsp:Transcript_32799/g.57110  ORF Transcript_32799/g.57110 Transcript_32799/m.57110 type:complete len:514 (-) Transcript_32799:4060-5601(-)|eukprot:CAMPEP_0204901682 /NCGR_PEP_ID=MMETSP1397-20131031/3218_1 /ASSEMBLY_ACC=CAM_ASM_000891 /TAXON_ID=49980 /ORGANISM="Climacostomum Climacostomum virens, Strain Stock W-24" /LENGTH=513 /DNA_ID=CAMNT_0052070069 /DNA_START=1021 /DNA_END=2562 /DNA_ORIENTATION=-
MGSCCTTGSLSRLPFKARRINSSLISERARLENVRDSYRFVSVVGQGQYGVVREAVRKIDNQKVAVKSIVKKNLKSDLTFLRRELEVLQTVDHPNIIRLYETFEDEKYLHLVTELCTGGELLERLLARGLFSEAEAAITLRTILSAVYHLHTIQIVHRDLKPDNILYSNSTTLGELKIADFGLSCKFSEFDKLSSFVGTPYYLAPEVIKGKYSYQCDVWSLGVMTYFLLSGNQPFEAPSVSYVLQRIAECRYDFGAEVWREVSSEAMDLISKMLVMDPRKRLTIPQVLEHPWFTVTLSPKPLLLPVSVLDALKQSKTQNRLVKESIRMLVGMTTRDDILNLTNIFHILDIDQTGLITVQSLEKALQRCGIQLAEGEVRKIIDANDCGTGHIKYSDFLVGMLSVQNFLDEEAVWAAFKHFDSTNCGRISGADIKSALEHNGCSLNEGELEEILSTFNLTQDDLLDYETFARMIDCFQEEARKQASSTPLRLFELEPRKKTLSRKSLYEKSTKET